MINIDKKLEKIGFVKIEEDKHGAMYERNMNGYNYTHVVNICHKISGNHLILSYVKAVNQDGFNDTVGLTYEECRLVMKKYRQLKRKYKWGKKIKKDATGEVLE